MKFIIFSTIFDNFGIKKYLVYPEQTADYDKISISNAQKEFSQYRSISRTLADVETLLYPKSGISSLIML